MVITWIYTGPYRSGVSVSCKRILVYEFTSPHKFANYIHWVLISTIALRVAEMLLRRGSEQDGFQYCILGHEENTTRNAVGLSSIACFTVILNSRVKFYASVIIVFIVNFVKIFDIITIQFYVVTNQSPPEYDW